MREPVERSWGHGFVYPDRQVSAYQDGGTLALGVCHTPESLVIKSAVPGIKPDEVDVTVTGNVLSIQGEARDEEEVGERSYVVRERRYGANSRTVNLPRDLKMDAI
ncbi:MAG: Hsp20/alpha crystallin family protein [Dehalococcoidia bacterium]|jgi:HSP20 family protein|nr:Hsp20/alpha crystallin family protein [Dehalococcoidia bacterium]